MNYHLWKLIPVKEEKDSYFFPGIFQSLPYLVIERGVGKERQREGDRGRKEGERPEAEGEGEMERERETLKGA